MSDQWVIRAEALRKVYRLYRRPAYRFLDVFGLCPGGARYYSEHPALDSLDLTVGRGEKVAIIGRNGAGKTTLLKIITGVLPPTSGRIQARGSVKALLDIGTGFHPDFTGRENVLSSLAHQGIVGKDALDTLDEIVDFAELEEYIDQPMKTYSTGMTMRLMFSTATSVEPDILIADEVLGVGDAYFAGKSFARMKELSKRHATTFLLVTHDVYSALNVCDRFIWIDHGRIQADGPGKSVISAYEQSIKEQEEIRLRDLRLKEQAAQARSRSVPGVVLSFGPDGAHTIDEPFILTDLALTRADGARTPLDMIGDGATRAIRCLPSGCVSKSTWSGRPCLRWAAFGDIFHKMEFFLAADGSSDLPPSLTVEYQYAGMTPVAVSVSRDHRLFHKVGVIGPTGPSVRCHTLSLDAPAPSAPPTLAGPRPLNRYGTADITIEAVRLLTARGRRVRQFRHADPMIIQLEYHVRNPQVQRDNVVAIAFHQDGAIPATRLVNLNCSFAEQRGVVTLTIPKLHLARGLYTVSAGIFRPEYARRLDREFFASSPNVLDCLARTIEFEVLHDELIAAGVIYLEDCEWR